MVDCQWARELQFCRTLRPAEVAFLALCPVPSEVAGPWHDAVQGARRTDMPRQPGDRGPALGSDAEATLLAPRPLQGAAAGTSRAARDDRASGELESVMRRIAEAEAVEGEVRAAARTHRGQAQGAENAGASWGQAESGATAAASKHRELGAKKGPGSKEGWLAYCQRDSSALYQRGVLHCRQTSFIFEPDAMPPTAGQALPAEPGASRPRGQLAHGSQLVELVRVIYSRRVESRPDIASGELPSALGADHVEASLPPLSPHQRAWHAPIYLRGEGRPGHFYHWRKSHPFPGSCAIVPIECIRCAAMTLPLAPDWVPRLSTCSSAQVRPPSLPFRARAYTQVVVVHVPPPRAGNQRSEGDSVTLRLLLSAAHANALCFLLAPYSESAGPAPAACFQDTCAPKARSGGQGRKWAAIVWMCP